MGRELELNPRKRMRRGVTVGRGWSVLDWDAGSLAPAAMRKTVERLMEALPRVTSGRQEYRTAFLQGVSRWVYRRKRATVGFVTDSVESSSCKREVAIDRKVVDERS
jgi:hypothetical protein